MQAALLLFHKLIHEDDVLSGNAPFKLLKGSFITFILVKVLVHLEPNGNSSGMRSNNCSFVQTMGCCSSTFLTKISQKFLDIRKFH